MSTKHSRTYHLPWSQGVSSDDRVLKSVQQFEGHRVVVTEKRDGECTSLYSDGKVHARSIDGTNYPWQAPIKAMWSQRCHDLPKGWRVVGENLYAKHSIGYDNLVSWFEVFAIFDENDVALSWSETEEWCRLLSLETVPVLWRGEWNRPFIELFDSKLNLSSQEGYVVRLEGRLASANWCHWVGKWVRRGHVQTEAHWTKHWTPNKLGV